jgi:hypothetical protein
MMKILKCALDVSVLSVVLAGSALASEDLYPAYNFQPSVIYSNAELIAKTSGATLSSSAGGAAATVQAAAPSAEVDPKYPAAYFTPSIIYPAH